MTKLSDEFEIAIRHDARLSIDEQVRNPSEAVISKRTYKPNSELFPTMVIGSLPRPRWVIDLVNDRENYRITESEFNRAIDPAVRFAIAMQERAGIDIVTDGEWRRQTYFTGFARAVEGFADDVIEVRLLTGATKTWPAVVSKLKYVSAIACDEAAFVKQHTARKVKATLPSPYMIDRWFYDPEASGDAYPRREDLIQDAADILRGELLALRDKGVDIVQFDDAMIGRFVGTEYNSAGTNPKVKITMADRTRELEMATWGLNRAVEGVSGVTTALHVCRGHRARMHVAHGGFEPLVPHLYQANVDILALELAADDAGTAETLKDFPDDKILGMGVIDVLSREIDPPERLVERVESMLPYVDRSRIFLNPDCGFAPAHDNPISLDEAYAKLCAVAEAAKRLREGEDES
jgi:5-methyltetrahydropteroyltriglutamate--homocysteine methyltransferase